MSDDMRTMAPAVWGALLGSGLATAGWFLYKKMQRDRAQAALAQAAWDDIERDTDATHGFAQTAGLLGARAHRAVGGLSRRA
jgi:hypothetical protein